MPVKFPKMALIFVKTRLETFFLFIIHGMIKNSILRLCHSLPYRSMPARTSCLIYTNPCQVKTGHIFSHLWFPKWGEKSSLILPVKHQDQERPIKSAKLFSCSLNIAQCLSKPLHHNDMMNKIRSNSSALKHDEIMWQFVENQRIRKKSFNIAQVHPWPFQSVCTLVGNFVCGECIGSVYTNFSISPIIAQYHVKSRTTIRAIWRDGKLEQLA